MTGCGGMLHIPGVGTGNEVGVRRGKGMSTFLISFQEALGEFLKLHLQGPLS